MAFDSDADAVVLGGGFAGLSCAVFLSRAGRRVLLIEKKPRLGGRAFSFKDEESGDCVDNGQHLMMACYRDTRRFLEIIGSAGLLRLESRVRVDFADASGARDALSCPAWMGAPLHLAVGVLGLRGLSLADKAGLWRLDRSLRRIAREGVPAELDGLTVRQWLDGLGQSRRIQQRLFDPIAIGALNDDPEIAAATGLAQVMTEAFYKGAAQDSRFALSTVGLSDLYTEAARRVIVSAGGSVLAHEKVVAVLASAGRVSGVVTERGGPLRCETVVSSLPPWDLARLELPAPLRGGWTELKAAPIVSVSLWLDRPIFAGRPFIGLLGTELQWVFDKGALLDAAPPPPAHARPLGLGEMPPRRRGQYLSCVISAAHAQLALSPAELLRIVERDLGRCFPEFQKATILRWKVVKEPFATLSPVPGSDARRVQATSALPGFYFAGDWTKTGLPATIESAVKSGRTAAELILRKIR